MADLNDVARMGFVIDSFDDVTLLYDENGNQQYSNRFSDASNNPAPIVLISKRINGTYYISEAVADSKNKRIWVESARISKKGVMQVATANGHAITSETHPTSTPASSILNGDGESNTLEPEKALNRVARSILRKYGSQYDQQQLADDLRGLFDTIGNEQEFDGDAAMAAATTIARKVLNESTKRDDSVYDATADARAYFRRGHFALTETQKQEVAIIPYQKPPGNYNKPARA